MPDRSASLTLSYQDPFTIISPTEKASMEDSAVTPTEKPLAPGQYPDNPEEKESRIIPLPNYPDWTCREQRGEEFHNGYSFGLDNNRRWMTFRTNARLSVPELEQVLYAYTFGRNTENVEMREAQRARVKKFLMDNELIGPLRMVLGILMGER